MSFERAYLACKICHRSTGHPYSFASPLPHLARLNTMEALEHAETLQYSSYALEKIKIANEALKICFNCQYEHPKVADLLKEQGIVKGEKK